MSAITNLANKVHVNLSQGTGAAFDPTIIIGIITALFTLFKNCKLPANSAKKRAENVVNREGLGWRLDTLRFRRVIADKAPSDQTEEIEAAILDASSGTTEAEFAACLSEV